MAEVTTQGSVPVGLAGGIIAPSPTTEISDSSCGGYMYIAATVPCHCLWSTVTLQSQINSASSSSFFLKQVLVAQSKCHHRSVGSVCTTSMTKLPHLVQGVKAAKPCRLFTCAKTVWHSSVFPELDFGLPLWSTPH